MSNPMTHFVKSLLLLRLRFFSFMFRSAILEPDFYLGIKQKLFMIATFIMAIIHPGNVLIFLQMKVEKLEFDNWRLLAENCNKMRGLWSEMYYMLCSCFIVLDAGIKVGRNTIGDVMKHDEKDLEKKNAHKDKANKAVRNIIYVSIKIKIKLCVR